MPKIQLVGLAELVEGGLAVVPGVTPGGVGGVAGAAGFCVGVVVLPDWPGMGVSVFGAAFGSMGGGAVEGCLGCVPSIK